ncbi:endoplasmic reticulum-Golgi intermediate compartment protein 2-like [Narcine bancroftii]|uniref:endoplasmic reticulum-Golgi intermediate compartment protein 2-like n=1 Tax=Narcine bancroftii TaxID=1343680 RepID=UPI0038320492
MRRRVTRKITPSIVKKLDAFPKVVDVCIETSAVGGTVSLLAFTLIATLTVGEYWFYRDTRIRHSYQVDTEISSKLQVNIDITVAMNCDHIGADITDRMEEADGTSGEFQYQPTYFELSAENRVWQRMMQNIHQQLQEEHNFLDALIKSPLNRTSPTEGPRDVDSADPPNACRIHGAIEVNKVAGSFHVLSGKSYQLPVGHTHVLTVKTPEGYNFSHRINHFSFGMPGSGFVSPLDGSEKVTELKLYMFQYFLIVVPTEINTSKFSMSTHQFSVTEQEKKLAGMSKKHDTPGIVVKYDFSCLKILISEEGMSTTQFLVRLCGLVGGIFSTADENETTSIKEHQYQEQCNCDIPVVLCGNTK